MNMSTRLFFIARVITIVATLGVWQKIIPTAIDHKALDITGYMQQISGNQGEKSQLIEYIHNNGTYLDIGSGSDTIASIINKTQQVDYKIILGDLEKQVLIDALDKHPFLVEHMHNKKPALELRQINATNMVKIETNSLDALSASALLHEVFSYCPPKSSIDQFLGEVCRTLKEGAVFIYRDTAPLDHTTQFSTLALKTRLVREFFNVWSSKFLNRKFSNILDQKSSCNKPTKHDASKILVSYKQCKDKTTKLRTDVFLDEFLVTSSDEIDFESTITIVATRLFIAEFLRHYVLFLQDNQHASLLSTLTATGFSMQLKKKNAAETLKNLFCRGVEPNLVKVIDDSIILDVKMLSLLWKSKFFNGSISYTNTYEHILDWLNREGEEHYFYLDLDSLITYVAQFSIDELKHTKEKDLILVPLQEHGIRSYDRKYYKELLSREVVLRDINGNKQDIVTHKNVIHFQMVPMRQGIAILTAIAEQHQLEKLSSFVQSFQ